MSTLDVPLGPIAPRCATHPEEAASGICTRCGTFFCSGCVRWISDQAWCSACAARPEINYLERLRLKLWGRRDFAAWLAGVFSVALGALIVLAVRHQRTPWLIDVLMAVCSVSCMAFFLGLRRAREALILTTLGCAAALLAFDSPTSGLVFLFGGAGSIVIYFDTRNRLFFQQPVSPERLQRLWHHRENNPRARDAMNLGLASVLFPVFAPLATVVGVIALRKVDPHAVPPIGRKGQAIAGIVLGTLLTVLWGVLLWALVGRTRLG